MIVLSRRRKVLFFWAGLAILIIVTLLFLLLRTNQLYRTAVTEPEQETIDEVISQVEDMDEDMQTTTNDLSENLRNAVEQTLTVFTQNDYHITALGDSLTQGVGDETNRDGYLSTLKRRLTASDYRVRIENFGRRGFQTTQIIERIEEENTVQRSLRRADIVLLTVGANDMLQIVRDNILNLEQELFESEINDYELRLTELIETIRTYNEDADIFLIGFYNPFEGYFDDIDALEDILIEWNNTGEAVFTDDPHGHFIPIHDLFGIEQVNLLADDNFHPNETGYSLIGARVFEVILPIFEQFSDEEETSNGDGELSED